MYRAKTIIWEKIECCQPDNSETTETSLFCLTKKRLRVGGSFKYLLILFIVKPPPYKHIKSDSACSLCTQTVLEQEILFLILPRTVHKKSTAGKLNCGPRSKIDNSEFF